MLDQEREKLRAIKTFPSLVKYLRDELDWPIETDDFNEIVFDYEAEELGIDPETAVKIDEIKQLRPLVTNQPWGIFFIKFEPKRLPVVVLRRILSRLVFKKRASANKPEHASWNLADLLFISNYGEDEQRQITFAHFSQDKERGDLPTLKVLGWDDADTALHLDHCHQELKGKLHWPDDEHNLNDWCEKWSSVFILRHREVITTSKDLAMRLADLARRIRRRANRVLAFETERGQLRKLYKAFQEALIHDLSEDDFADMYAQTIAYGLLAARVSRPMGVTADNIADMIPITNPFLKEMLGTFLTAGGRKGAIDFDELGIQEVVELLNSPDTHMYAILRDFGNRTQQEDPVIHFYEDFLSEYDKKKKVQRGVFFTPQPVVSYIVRSVHELLKSEFGLEDGLADITTWGEMVKRKPDIKIPEGLSPDEPFVQILDPAAGTATFLVEVIDIIHKTMRAKWIKQGHMALETQSLWNEYVPKHLLSRLYGFELMMAPYAIAHMKLGLKLYETGYMFNADERIHVYLTNSLEPAIDSIPQRVFEQWLPALAHEAQAVNEVKRIKRFTAVIGNPPYSYRSANMTMAAASMIEPFRYVDGERIKERSALSLERSLQDDFVKFLGLARSLGLESGVSILGFITNNSYLDSPLFRGLRNQLVTTYQTVFLLNLFGDSIKDKEENVFDIQQGVALIAAVRCSPGKQVKVNMCPLHGTRTEKYEFLSQHSLDNTPYSEVHAVAPHRYFIELKEIDEYMSWPSLSEIFQLTSTCIKTLKDRLATDFDRDEVSRKIRSFCDPALTKKQIKEEFGVEDVVQWQIEPARKKLRGCKIDSFLALYQARPFDYRWMFYHSAIIGSPRYPVMRHLYNRDSLALIANRKVRTERCNHFWITPRICVSEIISNADNSNCFPLYLFPESSPLGLGSEKVSNFTGEFLILLSNRLGLSQMEYGLLPKGLSAEDILFYTYAVFHSPTYRTRYAELLKVDFPRLPLTSSLELFRALSQLGGKMVALHLMESPKLNTPITKWLGSTPSNEVEKVTYSDETVWIDKGQTEGFRGVPENVWDFYIGGYQVCGKWLKDRRGRVLSMEDITHYQKIIVALNETIRLMKEIDEVIEEHGGWPGAFEQDH